jgi:NACalpha-BTF3-like transcription factor
MSEISGIFPTPDDKDRLMAQLKSLGVATLEVVFSGGGDSGAIDCVEAFSAEVDEEHRWRPGKVVKLEGVMFANAWEKKSVYNDMTRSWEDSEVRVPEKDITLVLEQVCYEALSQTGLDWYNNDGGQGTFKVTFDESGEPVIELEVGVNYTETDTHLFDVVV